MSAHVTGRVGALGLLALVGCGDAGGQRLTLALRAGGTEAQEVAIRGGSIQLGEARLALGPLYLCAATSADPELCETAVGEWLDARSLDALEPAGVTLGEINAVGGSVRSAQLDYGISWLLTRTAPEPSADAPGGHSAVLSGSAQGKDGTSVSFEAAVDLPPLTRGGSALSLRIDEHALVDGRTLLLRVDPNAWVARVRYADLFALDQDGDGQV
ncbi:MAG TPA: hypothetical protein VFZ61_01675, partial [Polyangiales bacterium]